MENEIWKDVEGFEKYQISSYGRVRSYYNNKEIILKPSKKNTRYYFVVLYNNNIPKTSYLHRLVAENFIPNPDNKLTVNHLNGLKHDNQVTNLEWATPKENTKHGWKTGLMENTRKAVKKNIIKAYEARKIPIYSKKLDMQFESLTEAAKYIQNNYFSDIKLEYLKTGICSLLKNKTNKSIYDYGWSYINK